MSDTKIQASTLMGKVNPTTLSDLLERMEAAKAELRTHGADALKAEFKKFFDGHPRVTALRWTQYTPYFNDGETCEFRVNSDWDIKSSSPGLLNAEASGRGIAVDEDDFQEGYISNYAHPDKEEPRYDPAFRAACEAYKSLARIDDEVFRIAFGDHVQVTASREGFEVESYDHD